MKYSICTDIRDPTARPPFKTTIIAPGRDFQFRSNRLDRELANVLSWRDTFARIKDRWNSVERTPVARSLYGSDVTRIALRKIITVRAFLFLCSARLLQLEKSGRYPIERDKWPRLKWIGNSSHDDYSTIISARTPVPRSNHFFQLAGNREEERIGGTERNLF